MKKGIRTLTALVLGLTLLVPSFASAAVESNASQVKEKKSKVMEKFNLSQSEKSKKLYQQKKAEKENLSNNTIIIKYSKKLSSSVHKKLGGKVIRSYPEFQYEVVRIGKGQKIETAISKYEKVAGVKSVSPSVKLKTFATESNSKTSDPKASSMYHLKTLKVDEALKKAGKNKVNVAVIDTGIDTNHEELKGNLLAPYSVTDPANPGDAGDHGTHVAGIIGGKKGNGVGGYGVNPNANIMPVNIFDQNGSFDYVLADGIMHAVDNGAEVINMSLGAPFEIPLVEEALKKAVDNGVVVVAAAGNDGDMVYNYPGSYDGVITVGATNDQNKKSYFTTYGPNIDVVAPGEDIYSTVYTPESGSSFVKMSGTSMASPAVAGVASLIKSKYPNLNSYQVEYILEQTAQDLGNKGFDMDYGYGLVDPSKALDFDINKLPSFKKLTMNEIVKKATAVNVGKGTVKKTGSLIKPAQQDWYKVNVEEGEFLQTVLDASKNYDYKLELKFRGEDGTEQEVDVDSVTQGKTEGYLYKAEQKGELLIGVKDRNENYSTSGASTYTLQLTKGTNINDSKASKEKPAKIKSFPYSSKKSEGDLTLINSEEGADSDYFRMSFKEGKKVNLDLSALPGVDTEIKVYDEAAFKEKAPADLPEGEEWPIAEYAANNNGMSEGEGLAFEALPDTSYIVEVTSSPVSSSQMLDMMMALMMGGSSDGEVQEVLGSLIPYDLKANVKDLPEDEDSLPLAIAAPVEEPEEEESLTEPTTYKEKYDALTDLLTGEYMEFDEETTEAILKSARSYEIGSVGTGYFQQLEDEDWFKVKVKEDGFYKLSTNGTHTLKPMIGLFQYDKESGMLNQLSGSGDPLMDLLTGGNEGTSETTIMLQKGQEYYIHLQNGTPLSLDKYELTSVKVKDAPVDQNEANDEPIEATVLKPDQPVKGNFTPLGDIDTFYYKHRKEDGLYGFYANPLPVSENQKKGLPLEMGLPLDLMITIVEDTNGNMEIDNNEASKVILFDKTDGGIESGSFKAKKGTGYFIVAENYGGSNIGEYEMLLNTLTKKDEDEGSTVKNNVPSKPLALKSKGKNTWEAAGYLNAGIDFGDRDFYTLNVSENGTYELNMDVPKEIDGVINVYNEKGTLVKQLNNYYIGDNEVGFADLSKGKYFMEIKDKQMRSSAKPYKLTVAKQ